MILIFRALFLSLLLTSGQASAVEFNQVKTNESSVTFAYKQMGVPMDGKFGKFAVQIAFDPARISSAQARIEIALASIDTGSAEANQEVAGKLWFNAQSYPAATFVSTAVKTLGGNRYEAIGKLTIKGTTLDVVAPFTFQSGGVHGTFDGTLNINRLDYKIGEAEWTDVSTVANEIQIRFHVVVTAMPGKK